MNSAYSSSVRQRERWLWLALLLASLVLHLWGLGDRTFHHDESIHADFARRLAEEGAYRYDPTYHGPLLYYLTAGSFQLFGQSDFSARLPIAICGVLLVAVAWRLRGIIGPRGAIWTGVLVTLSPLYLYFGRFLRMDVLMVLVTSLAFISFYWALRRNRLSSWAWFGLWTGLAFATKENSFVTGALVVFTGLAMALMRLGGEVVGSISDRRLAQGQGTTTPRQPPIEKVLVATFFLFVGTGFLLAWLSGWGKVGSAADVAGLVVLLAGPSIVAAVLVTGLILGARRLAGGRALRSDLVLWSRRYGVGLGISLLVFAATAVTLYTVGFRFPGDWFFPAKAIAYWWQQHEMERVGGVLWYHWSRLALYEFLPLALAMLWYLRRLGRHHPVEHFLFIYGMASVAMYSYLGEKVAWLGVHQVWAFLPLAGMQLARLLHRHRYRPRMGLATAGLALTAWFSLQVNFRFHEVNPSLSAHEMLHYVQATENIGALAAEGQQYGRESLLLVSGVATWPLAWYWRQQRVLWALPDRPLIEYPVIAIVDPDQRDKAERLLGAGYHAEVVPLRAWWIPEAVGLPNPRQLLDYLLHRIPWNYVGSVQAVVFRLQASDGSQAGLALNVDSEGPESAQEVGEQRDGQGRQHRGQVHGPVRRFQEEEQRQVAQEKRRGGDGEETP